MLVFQSCVYMLSLITRSYTLFVHSLLCSLPHSRVHLHLRLSVFRQISFFLSFFVFFFFFLQNITKITPAFVRNETTKISRYAARRETTTTHRKETTPFYLLLFVARPCVSSSSLFSFDSACKFIFKRSVTQ